ncbi:MAG: vWA domain-containing protein [Planctomycetota bacterium]
MVAEWVAGSVLVFSLLAEWIHWRRVRRLAPLAFGPSRRARAWVRAVPLLRAAAFGAASWGLVTLLTITPKVHSRGEAFLAGEDYKHLVLALDVSPSMRLVDAGPSGVQSRLQRSADLLQSFFERVALEQYRISIVAFYNGAKPVVVDTRDAEVVRNILEDLPMHYAFRTGKTDIFAGLEKAAEIALPWNPRSTIVLLMSDGDTVPAQGMPKMPASVSDILVVGVGDPSKGKFIDGRQSRQDTSTLRQVATRLSGSYHNGNEKHLPTDLIRRVSAGGEASAFEKLTRREYALIAVALGAAILALLPLALHYVGTAWRPGVRTVLWSKRRVG